MKITKNTKITKKQGSTLRKVFHTKICPINKVLAFIKIRRCILWKIVLKISNIPKMTKLEPNHKTQN